MEVINEEGVIGASETDELERKCGTCALYDYKHGGCVRTQTKESPEHYCKHWTDTLGFCDICGSPYFGAGVITYEEEELLLICESCGSHLGRCPTCVYGNYCAFKEDTDCTLPHSVQETKQHGNMTLTRDIPNPERIKATCLATCKCGSGTYGCQRQVLFCPNYKMKRSKKNDEVPSV